MNFDMLTRPCLQQICRQVHRWKSSTLTAIATQVRRSSHGPTTSTSGLKPVTIETLKKQYMDKTAITMITAHNYPSALIAQEAGMDVVLVGDSLAMVSLGMRDTSEVTLDEMIIHAKAVSRATVRPFTIGDLPMGSYELGPEQALASSIRMVKEGRMKSVKLEGGREMATTVRKITTAGIPVCGHVGLTPQRQNALGGFRVQGNTVAKATSLFDDAKALQDAGAFMVVLECVPPDVAKEVTAALQIPTIGIGSGNGTSGQVLVQIDMLGTRPPDAFMPKFVKKYSDEWTTSVAGLRQYKEEVINRTYPAAEHCYKSNSQMAASLKDYIDQSRRSHKGLSQTQEPASTTL